MYTENASHSYPPRKAKHECDEACMEASGSFWSVLESKNHSPCGGKQPNSAQRRNSAGPVDPIWPLKFTILGPWPSRSSHLFFYLEKKKERVNASQPLILAPAN